MAKLAAEFLAATPPTAQDLEGEWMQTTQIVTQHYLNGGDGPDHVAFDSSGLRNVNDFRTLAWRLVIDRKRDGGLTITSHHLSGHANVYDNPGSPGDLVLDTEAEGDATMFYHCRLASSRRLVCVDLDPIGDGAAFARIR
jgi:hypothetical protein